MALADTSLSSRFSALSPNTQGALWIVVSCVLFSIMQAEVKLLGARLDTFQIAFFRCAFGLIVILPFMAKAGPTVFKTERPLAHLLRGCLGAGAMACGFYSVTHMPLADATAISFAKPLFMIVLAVLFGVAAYYMNRQIETAPDAEVSQPLPEDDRVLAVVAVEPLTPYEPVTCLLYTSPSPRDRSLSRMPSSA